MTTMMTTAEIETAKQLIAANPKLTGFVPGEGSLTPKLAIISEAPGAKEDELGHPFQGPAGQELNEWLAQLGLTRDQIYITGAVRARPFDEHDGRLRDRKPTAAEVAAFAPLLDHELARIPLNTLILPLGNTGLQRLLGPQYKITQVHGQLIKAPLLQYHPAVKRYEAGNPIRSLFPMFHPSYVRRFPSKRPIVEADLAVLKTLM